MRALAETVSSCCRIKQHSLEFPLWLSLDHTVLIEKKKYYWHPRLQVDHTALWKIITRSHTRLSIAADPWYSIALTLRHSHFYLRVHFHSTIIHKCLSLLSNHHPFKWLEHLVLVMLFRALHPHGLCLIANGRSWWRHFWKHAGPAQYI
jgi:hypothetical protein